MYRTDDCSSAAASSQPRAVAYTVPLDGALQSRSLQPLGTLQYNRPYASLSLAKCTATLALPSPNPTNDALKLEALSQLLDQLVRPETVTGILAEEGGFAELLLSAQNESAPVRVLATKALAVVTRARSGREFALAADVGPRFARLADATREPDAQVRRNVLQCLLHLVQSAAGITHLLSHAIPKQLIAKLRDETDLPTHSLCAQVLLESIRDPRAWKDAIAEGVVDTCSAVLRVKLDDERLAASAARIRADDGVVSTDLKPWVSSLEQLCKLIAHVSAPALSGKDACVEARMVPMLSQLLDYPVASVREAASLALQNLTNCESGKLSALAADSLSPLLVAALEDSSPLVQAQAMQSLANLSEHPKAKVDPRIAQALAELTRMQTEHADDKVRHAAKLAVDQITWQP